ncbi:tRNA 2-thiouridine-synthesizing protein [Pseudoalteromonas sp. SMS1]|uniref:DsrH/TusB family sulfur metabolism protein n=1 Tax=Pseudoalteromonas sp. SMS1 TaxID=2908894 RepID=UPI001F33916F|nr:DsrH/TusB family sulfur metabolism protein [Pseudoalteromonas sp. SMS1]MCF2857984.1 tRNA 2-thiouridine-synthesizing protein [Pseudoalteromonas sp. SMS1]
MSITIHIFSRPLDYYGRGFNTALVGKNDKVLLQQDACYDHAQFADVFTDNLYMLETCSIARGITATASVKLIDDLTWVDLIATSDKSITW